MNMYAYIFHKAEELCAFYMAAHAAILKQKCLGIFQNKDGHIHLILDITVYKDILINM